MLSIAVLIVRALRLLSGLVLQMVDRVGIRRTDPAVPIDQLMRSMFGCMQTFQSARFVSNVTYISIFVYINILNPANTQMLNLEEDLMRQIAAQKSVNFNGLPVCIFSVLRLVPLGFLRVF